MGATVTVGKKVAAFKSRNGKTGYVLFEQTYEKNCYPHHPHWSCVGLGYLEDVMARIFASGSSCEGGGLQGRGGCIKPESYIGDWLSEMATPLEMGNFRNKIAFGENFYATIPESLRERVLKGLEDEGFSEAVKALSGDGIEVALHDDIELIRAIYVKHRNELGPWRFIGRFDAVNQMEGFRSSDLGYTPGKDQTYKPQVPLMFAIDNEALILEQPNGTFRTSGAAYSCTATFVEGYGLTELAHPGTFRKSIKTFRDAVKTAPMASDETRIVVSVAGLPADQQYRRDRVQTLADHLGQKSTEFETSLGDVRRVANDDNHLIYHLMHMETLVWKPKLVSEPIQQESLFGETAFA
ncbi:hypothetical protein [Polaromonas aquatica]|uniref:Uncharacterized protein n=1 Tax=Polaromonas aquatica TaxID=332657 RepID=A0ABW1TWN0_9BURK